MTRAVFYDHVGGPEVLYLAGADDVPPGPGTVTLRVKAAGLNPFDSKVRSGVIPSSAPFPRRLGSDVAGTVEAVGESSFYVDGSPVAVGDEVFGRATGSLAERAVASASDLALRPSTLPVAVAGALHVAGLTAVSCLATVPISSSDTVLIGGASGAVGLVATQLAVAVGARVIGTASAENHDFVRALGAEPVEYGAGVAARVAALAKVTAVFDCHGRDALDAGVQLGVPADRMVAIAAYAALEEIGAHNVERQARTAENLASLAERIADGQIRFPVAATFPLEEIRSAFRALEASHAPGKIVVLS